MLLLIETCLFICVIISSLNDERKNLLVEHHYPRGIAQGVEQQERDDAHGEHRLVAQAIVQRGKGDAAYRKQGDDDGLQTIVRNDDEGQFKQEPSHEDGYQ